jgi:hypothetical protein
MKYRLDIKLPRDCRVPLDKVTSGIIKMLDALGVINTDDLTELDNRRTNDNTISIDLRGLKDVD